LAYTLNSIIIEGRVSERLAASNDADLINRIVIENQGSSGSDGDGDKKTFLQCIVTVSIPGANLARQITEHCPVGTDVRVVGRIVSDVEGRVTIVAEHIEAKRS